MNLDSTLREDFRLEAREDGAVCALLAKGFWLHRDLARRVFFELFFRCYGFSMCVPRDGEERRFAELFHSEVDSPRAASDILLTTAGSAVSEVRVSAFTSNSKRIQL